MNIIIVGCGRVGQTLAEKLNSDGNDVTVIDTSAEKVKTVADRCDVMGVIGNGATLAVQQEAGVDNADLLIAVTNSDELNLLCCMIAKKAGNCQTIARVKNPDYSKEAPYLKDELGLAMVINPEYAAAEEIARVLWFPSAIKIERFAKGKVELIKFRLPKDCKIIGMSVKDVVTKLHCDVLVCTIERGDEAYIANGDFVFAEKDVVSIVASPKKARDFFGKIHYKGHSIKDAIIVGGGSITHYLCEILERSSLSVKIIEKDRKVCDELCSKWPKVDVIHGNGIDREVLLEEGVDKAGAFVALSNLDEENIILSLYAKDAGSSKTITKINRIDYDNVINRLDLDTMICPKNIISDSILRYVRATKNAQGSNVETLYNIIQDKVEAAEFIVKENSPIAGTPLSELKFKDNVLIASILRNKTVLIPRGHDVIEPGDNVIIVSKQIGLHDVADVLR
ncbi:MAG: Trk system potassium transporter TrkA [Clostridiales bacterium]|nr:Trk system potassium transporter TrkA [Clostridiales bacterium]